MRGSETAVVLLLEHKAGRDEGLLRQLMRYVMHVTTAAVQAGCPAPHVVPVVVHHGPPLSAPPWAAPLPDLEAAAAAELASFHPRMRFVLDDLARCTESELRARPLTPLGTLTLLFLRFLPEAAEDDVVASLQRWSELLRSVAGGSGGPLTIEALSSYVLHVTDLPADRLAATIANLLGSTNEDLVMSTADKLRAEGKAEGKIEGRLEVVQRQLEARFGTIPETIRARLRAASRETLDRWAVRILDAKSIEDVFAA